MMMRLLFSGLTWEGGGGEEWGPDLRRMGGGARGRHRNDFIPHHIYCAQSKVKWVSNGGGGGGGGGHDVNGGGHVATPHSYATVVITIFIIITIVILSSSL